MPCPLPPPSAYCQEETSHTQGTPSLAAYQTPPTTQHHARPPNNHCFTPLSSPAAYLTNTSTLAEKIKANMSTQRLKALWLAAAASIAVSGCSVQIKEGFLKQAGFVKVPAETPEQIACVQNAPQHTLVRHVRDGRVRYVFADAAKCKCLYIGNEDAWQEYRRIRAKIGVQEAPPPIPGLNHPEFNWQVWDMYFD